MNKCLPFCLFCSEFRIRVFPPRIRIRIRLFSESGSGSAKNPDPWKKSYISYLELLTMWSVSSTTLSKPSFRSHKFINGWIRTFNSRIHPDPKHWVLILLQLFYILDPDPKRWFNARPKKIMWVCTGGIPFHTSSSVQAVFFISGLRWLCQRSRHCFPIRPFRCLAMRVQRFGPYFFTNSITFSSSSLVQGPVNKKDKDKSRQFDCLRI